VQTSLFCALIELLDEGRPVTPPEGIVYSTAPRKVTGLDTFSYFVKGPEPNIVVAEAVAHQLAESLNLKIPAFGVAVPDDTGNAYFASREVERCQRQIDRWIERDRTINRRDLAKIVVFDIWVMNYDRNMNNVVGAGQLAPNDGKVEIIAIDFEKSAALRGPYPLMTTAEIDPRKLWPTGTLGNLVVGAPIPGDFCDAIHATSRDHVLDAFAKVEARINKPIEWKESSAKVLTTRAANIRRLAQEVWK
jgi:HipA-like kinase